MLSLKKAFTDLSFSLTLLMLSGGTSAEIKGKIGRQNGGLVTAIHAAHLGRET
jgi:hypothetical protein